MKLKKQLKIAKRHNASLLHELEFCSKAREVDLGNMRKAILGLRNKRVQLIEREKELAAALQTIASFSKRVDFSG